MKGLFIKAAFIFIVTVLVARDFSKQPGAITANFQIQPLKETSVASMPEPDHIVIVVLENHEYSQIMGSKDAPYINTLAKDPLSALFKQSYIIEHPSQPNYLDLYSGNNQGVTDDSHPANEPFTSPNLGRQLIDAGKSYATYSEDLPSIGYNGDKYGEYVRKHNPAANWMGTGKNQIPVTTNLPFAAFPSDYTKLPTVSLVVPNEINDMHNGSITAGDIWVKNNLDGYIQWAKKHNSILILTFDEDDYGSSEHIVTIFTGEMVKGGAYKNTINHYNVLRTIEEMYGLSYAGNAAKAKTIDYCWR